MKTLLIILIVISAIMAIDRGIRGALTLRDYKRPWYEIIAGFLLAFLAGAVLWPGLFIYWTIKAINPKNQDA